MFTFVSADWVQGRLDSPEILLLDPRSALRYMSGHPKNAVSLPAVKASGANGLRSVDELTQWIGAAGLDDRRIPVLYDSADGRNAAMLAWILLHLGRTDVHLMDVFWEKWTSEKREVFYRPVAPVARQFTPRVRPELRATLDDVRGAANGKFVDFRSADEFSGKLDTEGKPGHIPGAVNVVWQELTGTDQRLLAPREKLQTLFASRGISPGDRVVAYCRSGQRASLGFLALAQLGVPVTLYDGSYAEWARSGLPVESSRLNS
jgi:thiosulfate/3-mercaptopyruvate sulfurtransferase